MGTIYLLHFDQKIGRSQHYLGWTSNLDQRLEDHRTGRGGKTTARFRAAGIGFELAAQWSGSPDDEKRLKNKSQRSLCSICKERTMTVLEALQQNVDLNRKVTMSLTDLAHATKNSRSRVRQELKALLDEGKMTVASKGDAGQNKTVYELALCVPLPATVQENCAPHSVAQLNRIAELDTTKFADSIELSTVPPHSALRTVVNGSSHPQLGASQDGDPTRNAQLLAPQHRDPRTTALPPSLSYFTDLNELGRCLDLTCHYIVDVSFVNLVLHYPDWGFKYRPSGMVRILHVPYCDSRIRDIFHGVFYFPVHASCVEENCKCRQHRLMRLVRDGFPTAIETHARIHPSHDYVEALYDIRRFCPQCAGLPVLPAMFSGFEYAPYEQPPAPLSQPVKDVPKSEGALSS
jgi:predicted GIY-YIG superfamily endonuclease